MPANTAEIGQKAPRKRTPRFSELDKEWFDEGEIRLKNEVKSDMIPISAISVATLIAIFSMTEREKSPTSQFSLALQAIQAAAPPRREPIEPQIEPQLLAVNIPKKTGAILCTLQRTGTREFKAACDLPKEFSEVDVIVMRCGSMVRKEPGWCDLELTFKGGANGQIASQRIQPVPKIGASISLEDINL